jgi:hypothetical protein
MIFCGLITTGCASLIAGLVNGKRLNSVICGKTAFGMSKNRKKIIAFILPPRITRLIYKFKC